MTEPRAPTGLPVSALRAFGRGTTGFLSSTGRVVAFSARSGARALSTKDGLAACAQQALIIAARCAVPVALVAGPVGAMVALQALTLMQQFGVERALAPLVMATITREIAPGFAAVVVAMQGGAGIAAELGALRAKEEIDALDVMGLDSRALVAGPRVVGAAIATPVMNALAIAFGVGGAYAMSVLALGVPRTLFLSTLADGVGALDVWVSELKCVIFGVGLGAISTTMGYFASPDPRGVGRAANRAVVASVLFVLACNYLCNTAIFGLRGGSVPL